MKIWTEKDEVELDRLSNGVMKICHTEVGRHTGKVLDDATAVLSICSQEQITRLRGAISCEPIQELQVALPSQESQEEDLATITYRMKKMMFEH